MQDGPPPHFCKVSLALGQKGRYRHTQVHRLVAEAFLGPAPWPGAQVAHFDGNRLNNALRNLRWASASENAADRARHGRARGAHRGEEHHASVLSEDSVRELRRLRAGGAKLRDLAGQFGGGKRTAYDAVTGRTWGHVT